MTAPVHVGDIVAGRYRVERALGQGGMGIVVAARHVHLDEPVAIKFPLPSTMMSRDLVARVVREGRAAARLRGEHVARVIDVGTLDTGEPFLVFEYLRGSDLETVLESCGRIAVADAIEYVLQACEALAEAHVLGIVHRDLKPANLFLTRRPDGTPSIKIIDFGIAKARDADGAGSPVATESFMIFGTPLYMSPEQMRSSKDVDPRSDIWSLGAVLHHLVSGTPPFPPRSLPEIYQLAHAGAPPIRALVPEVPAAVEAALLRCLATDPAERFADVGALAAALAPHAPARAAVSVERAQRILAAGESTRDDDDDRTRSSLVDADEAAPAPTAAWLEAEGRVGFDGLATTLHAASPIEGRPSSPDRPSATPHTDTAESAPDRPSVTPPLSPGGSAPDRPSVTPPHAPGGSAPAKTGQRSHDADRGHPRPRAPMLAVVAVLIFASAATAWWLGRDASPDVPPPPLAASTRSGDTSAAVPATSAPAVLSATRTAVMTIVTPAGTLPTVASSSAPTSSAAAASTSAGSRGTGARVTAPPPAATPPAGPLDDPD